MVSEFNGAAALFKAQGLDNTIEIADSNGVVHKIRANSTTGVLEFYKANDIIQSVGSLGRQDLSGINIDAANTDGGIFKAGTSAARVIEDTANMKFMSFYFDNGAVSGDSRGIYLRQYITGAGGGGDAARFYETVENVAAATVRGAHISLDWGASGSCTGLGVALECTLHIRSTAGAAGTIAPLKVAVNSDASTSDPVGASLSMIQVVNQGDGTGGLDVDTDAALFAFSGFASASGTANMVSSTSLAELPASSIGFRVTFGGAVYYIPAVISTQWN
jgi:hypothetical protein